MTAELVRTAHSGSRVTFDLWGARRQGSTMSGMDGFLQQRGQQHVDGLHRTIAHLHQLAQLAEEQGDQPRADELRRAVKSYEAQLSGLS